MAVCVEVAVDDIINKIDKLYTYCVPADFVDSVCVGGRVIVPFSKSNIYKKALVFNVFETESADAFKNIVDVIDTVPLLSPLQLQLVKLLKNRYFVTYFRALKSIVPRGVDVSIKHVYSVDSFVEETYPELYSYIARRKGKVSLCDFKASDRQKFKQLFDDGHIVRKTESKPVLSEKSEKKLVLNLSAAELEDAISELRERFPKQADLLTVFLDYNELYLKDALYYSGVGNSTVKTLINKGFLELARQTYLRNPYRDIERKFEITPIKLSDDQSKIFNEIKSVFGCYNVHLVHGVTGSGKTLVYIAMIDELVLSGKSVIFMVPEISLTPQMLERFYGRYGDIVAVVHSGLSPGERADEWRKIKNNKQSVIVGTRSAVFSPVNNLGMIIIDEEHEYSYKSESTPRFHARDISKFICKKINIPLVIGSATPSIESRYLAEKGIYKYHSLTKRFNNQSLPEVEIVDMKTSITQGEQSFLSDYLAEQIEENLQNNQQTILFLNRRGTHTLIGCRSCGYVEKCPNCGIALTYHSANDRCMCHYCGYSVKMYDKCPNCASEHIKKLGIGTQLISSEISEKFPSAKVLRMDFDTVGSYIQYGEKLSDFKNGAYDIMLGTQMVAKGLDFPNVTLVGVINADLSLHVDDFRANERTFSLLTQVCGRSGRAQKPGKAVIQTYSPDYEIIRYAKHQDYDNYYDFEISFRKAMNYPPFCDLIQFTVSSRSENRAYSDMMDLYNKLNQLSITDFSDIPIRLLYPVAPKIAKFNERYRYVLTIKSKVSNRLYELLNIIEQLFENNNYSDILINVNPMNNV